MTRFLSLIVVAALASGSALSAPTAYTGQELAGSAKISLENARAAALKARPGRITDQELEKEDGGSGLRYSFDIKKAGQTYEVGVDAMTGAILENGRESRTREAAETRADHRSKPAAKPD
ncbi:MAG: PepSY domain-containing protein [Sphingomonadales bacterium]|jgi:uncharacterized membrane protein YkoI